MSKYLDLVPCMRCGERSHIYIKETPFVIRAYLRIYSIECNQCGQIEAVVDRNYWDDSRIAAVKAWNKFNTLTLYQRFKQFIARRRYVSRP